jgi:hypothetical protein
MLKIAYITRAEYFHLIYSCLVLYPHTKESAKNMSAVTNVEQISSQPTFKCDWLKFSDVRSTNLIKRLFLCQECAGLINK